MNGYIIGKDPTSARLVAVVTNNRTERREEGRAGGQRGGGTAASAYGGAWRGVPQDIAPVCRSRSGGAAWGRVRASGGRTLARPSPLWLSPGSMALDGPSLWSLVGSLINGILCSGGLSFRLGIQCA